MVPRNSPLLDTIQGRYGTQENVEWFVKFDINYKLKIKGCGDVWVMFPYKRQPLKPLNSTVATQNVVKQTLTKRYSAK